MSFKTCPWEWDELLGSRQEFHRLYQFLTIPFKRQCSKPPLCADEFNGTLITADICFRHFGCVFNANGCQRRTQGKLDVLPSTRRLHLYKAFPKFHLSRGLTLKIHPPPPHPNYKDTVASAAIKGPPKVGSLLGQHPGEDNSENCIWVDRKSI